MDKKSQFVVVALPAAAQGATVAATTAQCSVESRYPYVYLALRRTLYQKKIFPHFKGISGQDLSKVSRPVLFLIVLPNRSSQFSCRRNLIFMVLKQRPFSVYIHSFFSTSILCFYTQSKKHQVLVTNLVVQSLLRSLKKNSEAIENFRVYYIRTLVKSWTKFWFLALCALQHEYIRGLKLTQYAYTTPTTTHYCTTQ